MTRHFGLSDATRVGRMAALSASKTTLPRRHKRWPYMMAALTGLCWGSFLLMLLLVFYAFTGW